MRASLGMVLILLLLGSVWTLDAAGAGTFGAFDSRYRVPLSIEPSTLDPALITGIYAVNMVVHLFDGLVEFDNNLNIVPAIECIGYGFER